MKAQETKDLDNTKNLSLLPEKEKRNGRIVMVRSWPP
jgi:hypothetical protein